MRGRVHYASADTEDLFRLRASSQLIAIRSIFSISENFLSPIALWKNLKCFASVNFFLFMANIIIQKTHLHYCIQVVLLVSFLQLRACSMYYFSTAAHHNTIDLAFKTHLFITSQLCRSEIQAQCSWLLCSGTHETDIRVSTRLLSHLEPPCSLPGIFRLLVEFNSLWLKDCFLAGC